MSTRQIVVNVVAPPVADFVPAVGYRANINLNNLSSQDPCPTRTCWYSFQGIDAVWTNWTGAAFAHDYSAFGAMLFHGGGHNGYDGTEIYVFDLTTRLWERKGTPIPFNFLTQVDYTWNDYIYNDEPVPPATHTYGHPLYISSAQGGGTRGSYLLPYSVFGGGNGNPPVTTWYPHFTPHRFDLATSKWSRFTTNTQNPYYANGPFTTGFIDTNRWKTWATGVGAQQWGTIDLNQATKTVQLVTPNAWGSGDYGATTWVADKDLALQAWWNGSGISLSVLSLASGVPVSVAAVSGNASPSDSRRGFGMDWCPDNGKFYLYDGYGATHCNTLTPPPGNWLSGNWTWGRENFQGPAPALVSSDGSQPFTKWKYNSALKCFMWSAGKTSGVCVDGVTRDGIFQLWRPQGT